MGLISASVGQSGKNNRQDVKVVVFLLNRAIDLIYPNSASEITDGWGLRLTVISAGDMSKIIDAIRTFQKRVCGFRWPDGRVDPGKRTINRLIEVYLGQGNVIPLGPGRALKRFSRNSQYNITSGRWRILGSYKVGKIYAGLDGNRLLLSINSNEAIFLLLDNRGPGYDIPQWVPMRGHAGTIYVQHTTAFIDEWDSIYYHDQYQRLKPLQELMEIEAHILLGICSASGPAGFMLVMSTDGLRFIIENRHNFPKWIRAITVTLTARRILKRYARTLYEKLVDTLLLGVRRTTWAALGIAGDDVLANMEEAMVRDPKTVGRLIGAIISNVGKATFFKRFTLLGVMFSLLKTLATKSVLAVPGTVAITATEKIESSQRLIGYFREIGVSVSSREAERIIDEVTAHAREIKGVLEELAQAYNSIQS